MENCGYGNRSLCSLISISTQFLLKHNHFSWTYLFIGRPYVDGIDWQIFNEFVVVFENMILDLKPVLLVKMCDYTEHKGSWKVLKWIFWFIKTKKKTKKLNVTFNMLPTHVHTNTHQELDKVTSLSAVNITQLFSTISTLLILFIQCSMFVETFYVWTWTYVAKLWNFRLDTVVVEMRFSSK